MAWIGNIKFPNGSQVYMDSSYFETPSAPYDSINCNNVFFGSTNMGTGNYKWEKNGYAPSPSTGQIFITAPDKTVRHVITAADVQGYAMTNADTGIPYSSDDCLHIDYPDCIDYNPCDEIQATHVQVRVEYEGVANFSDVTSNTYQLMPITALPLVEEYQIALDSNRPYYYLRLRFCDASGAIKPYTGQISVIGASDSANINMFVENASLNNAGSWLSGKIQSFANIDGLYQHSYMLYSVPSSGVIYDPDCAEDPQPLPEEPEPIPPTELPIPEFPEPLDPEEPIEPETPTSPIPPNSPSPESGCECSEYIAESIQDLTRVMALELGKLRTDLVKSINALNVQLVSIDETNNKVLKWSIDTLFPELQRLVRAMYTIPRIKPEMSIVQVLDQINDNVKDFVIEYEPVNIENEYRTVSHRIIDDLDTTLSKL